MGTVYVDTIVYEQKIEKSRFWPCFRQLFFLLPIILLLHMYKNQYFDEKRSSIPYNTDLQLTESDETQCKVLIEELILLQREISKIKSEMHIIETRNVPTKIDEALDKFYSDQIGLFDYAAEYSGASIISTPNTVAFPSNDKVRLFGAFDIIFKSQPILLIRTTNLPGECFAFYGNQGKIRIKLGRPILITDVSLEHSKYDNTLATSPKEFSVSGFSSRWENLGNFTYNIGGRTVQTFQVTAVNTTFKLVELNILSNYGNPEFTCLYRFRVHSRHFL